MFTFLFHKYKLEIIYRLHYLLWFDFNLLKNCFFFLKNPELSINQYIYSHSFPSGSRSAISPAASSHLNSAQHRCLLLLPPSPSQIPVFLSVFMNSCSNSDSSSSCSVFLGCLSIFFFFFKSQDVNIEGYCCGSVSQPSPLPCSVPLLVCLSCWNDKSSSTEQR